MLIVRKAVFFGLRCLVTEILRPCRFAEQLIFDGETMDLKPDAAQQIEGIAKDTLTQFDKISQSAQDALRLEPVQGTDALATLNTFTDNPAIRRLNQINLENRESYQTLSREPAIARVVVSDTQGRQHVYFICRAVPVPGLTNLASYRAPVGRLASLPIGFEFKLPNNNVVEVLERAHLHPLLTDEAWDSRDTVVESDHFGPITVESLRALLKEVPATEDLLGQLLAQESQRANILEGVRRSVINKMALRDQPVLDQYQDEIFRLPLDMRLLILGPPGTGKTTTLIRRLGQKLDTSFLSEDEGRSIGSLGTSDGEAHSESWLMFTPTELLKQYLKEAFAREGVPASDQRIRTWADYRRDLARNTFTVLRTPTGSGSFVLKESIDILHADALGASTAWFTDFDGWQRSSFISEILTAAQKLSEYRLPEIARIGQCLKVIIERSNIGTLVDTFISLSGEVEGIQAVLSVMKETTDKKIHGTLNLQMNRNKEFIDELAKFIDGLQQLPDSDGDELDDQDSDEEDANLPKTGRAAAASAYMKALRAQARANANKRSIGKDSRNGKIIEWLGDRSLNEAEQAEIGESLLVQGNARRFVNPVKRYVDGIPRRYRVFRRLRQEENKWYRKEGFSPTDLHPLELDAILLAILRNGNEMLSRMNITRNIDDTVWSPLKPVLGLIKNQILVDEVTDFSPIQIGCMAALSNPRIRSFFACGDFNQRLTIWGSRTLDEMKWVFPEIEIKEITITYRQSRQLNELSRSIILATGGSDPGVTLPPYADSEGVKPVLLEGSSDRDAVVRWLAQRIREIECFVKQLPSIAIFVENESEVQPLADSLNAVLAAENTQVVACLKGQVMGRDNDVRIFDIQHIKGLEFEAVFFVAIDRLAALHPQLFDKYLYVGTTRAATYLGVTCDTKLPSAIASLRSMFVTDWKAS